MRLLYLLFTLILGSCSTYSEKDLNTFDKKIQEWIGQQEVGFKKTESGLYYSFEHDGSGRNIKYTDSVSVIFRGKQLNGTVFEQKKTPMLFAVKEVIIAWKEILLMSKNGAKVQIIVPPQLGYGNHELDKIPQNTILFYEIEIVDIK
jgi:FKBP-type peptidyl-prolyl cis-trans isomerase FkpA